MKRSLIVVESQHLESFSFNMIPFFSNLMIFFSFRKNAMMRFKFIESNLGPLVFTKHLEKKFTSVPSEFVHDRQKCLKKVGLSSCEPGSIR